MHVFQRSWHQDISRILREPAFSSRLTTTHGSPLTSPTLWVLWSRATTAIPVVEDTLASSFALFGALPGSPRPLLPTKPGRTTSALYGKSYIEASHRQAWPPYDGQSAKPTTGWMYLRGMDEGTGLTPEAVRKSCAGPTETWLWEPPNTNRGGDPNRRHKKWITTDAVEGRACGAAVFEGRLARGEWTGEFLSWHINCLELRAVCLALMHFLPFLGCII